MSSFDPNMYLGHFVAKSSMSKHSLQWNQHLFIIDSNNLKIDLFGHITKHCCSCMEFSVSAAMKICTNI